MSTKRWWAAAISPRTWRATLHVLAGGAVALAFGLVLAALLVPWLAAIYSLLTDPTGGWVLIVLYGLMAALGPVLLLWVVRGFSWLQRARFRALLGVAIPSPPPRPRGWRWLAPWGDASTWRQLAYHGLALVAAPLAALAVVAAWTTVLSGPWYALSRGRLWSEPALLVAALILLLAAPWGARGLARVDERVAYALLGTNRTEELTRRVESLARSRSEIIAATDAERRRIERDLHDGAQQRLVSLAMNLGMARAALGDDVPAPARLAIEQAHDEATQALAELREFVRGLHPAVMNDRGLDAALSGIVARAPIPVRLRVQVEPRCSASIEAIAYFTVSEALTNVAKHAAATRTEVTVERIEDRLRIVVRDDGRGGASEAGAGTGLRGLAQRAAAVDGTMTVHSPLGGPTTITVELPCES